MTPLTRKILPAPTFDTALSAKDTPPLNTSGLSLLSYAMLRNCIFFWLWSFRRHKIRMALSLYCRVKMHAVVHPLFSRFLIPARNTVPSFPVGMYTYVKLTLWAVDHIKLMKLEVYTIIEAYCTFVLKSRW